jgi:PAS domain S-box-containing protein
MRFDFPLFSLVFFAGSCLALFLAWVFYTRRPNRGAIPLTWFALSCTLWSLGAGLEAGAVTESRKILFSQIEYPGIIGAVLAWLVFALDYTGSDAWRRPRNIILLSIIPVITLILVATNNLHHWYWTGTVWEANSFGPILVYERGPWYWVFVSFSYVVYLAGVFFILRFGFKNQRFYRIQLAAICFGTIIPFIGSIMYLLKLSPVEGLDLAPFSFILVGVVYGFTLFRLRFLDMLPVARSALVEKMPDGIVVVDSNGMIVDMNPAAEMISGLTRLEATGHPAAGVWPQIVQIMASADSRGQAEIVTQNAETKSFIDVSITPLLNDNQQAGGQLLVFRDVTEQRKMEQNLRDSESRYSTLVEQSNEGVLIIQKGVFVFANRPISELTGYDLAEIKGQPVNMLIQEAELDRIKDRKPASQESKESPGIYEVQMRRKDGENRNVDISEGIIRFEGAEARIVSIRDITERKQTQQKLESLYAEELTLRSDLQAEIEKRSKYTRSLVHELKTPLNSISASVEVLEAKVKNDIYLALVKNIGRASINLDQRINELIELANGEIGMLKIEPLEVDLSVLLREIISEMTPVAAGKGLVTLQDIPDLPNIWGDRSRLRQVMTNLLSNAIKFTARGSILVKASRLSDREVMVQVIDTGRGMAAEEVENIFDPYRRTLSASHDMRGLGIGLALSKMFVELHKGRIFAESLPGKGSTFSFTVPIFQKDD